MNIWIYLPVILGVILFITSLILVIRIASGRKGLSKELVVSLFLTALSVGWIALGMYTFIVIRSQLMS
ncbi:hypothetical protein JZO66_07260 [Enterococcus sp. DIV0242_7C1]|uniref:Uncharacterized protein n=1 Tax=Candidatus Enterococcus dunnyi TaxID=1834192 RepID=A0A200IZ87_9ENTE|nr:MULTISPECIES: hypothetical protein [unclassified Enterococcus]MBO0470339.1 hypothetical protein [Enterococcus sp. DIV0242_7C1]OUZ30292.1 hypothetical protein A5889_002580 [Enterococcus sp. 9D6_DIV0238]